MPQWLILDPFSLNRKGNSLAHITEKSKNNQAFTAEVAKLIGCESIGASPVKRLA